MSNWLDKILPSSIRAETPAKASQVPEGLWLQCPQCQAALYQPDLLASDNVCPQCRHHFRLTARERLNWLFDAGSAHELLAGIKPRDLLGFRDSKKYKERLAAAQKETGEQDALLVMAGQAQGVALIACAFDFQFMGGSMGSVVGTKFARACDYALEHKLPLVCFSASGGARMQEALYSLMQMAKTSAATARLKEAGIPYISVLTDPVYGGVSASLAMLGDIILAEPKALVGFAGPRVIEQTVRQQLPEGFQRAEFLLEHGMLDNVYDRQALKPAIVRILKLLTHANP